MTNVQFLRNFRNQSRTFPEANGSL